MKTILKYGIFLVAFLAWGVTGYADTLILKNGERISGYYEGGTARVISFSTSAGVQEYDLLAVSRIEFGGDIIESSVRIETSPVPEQSPTAAPETGDAPVRLQTREESQGRLESASAANTAWTVPVGTSLLIRMIDSIDSETNAVGKVFIARLEEALMVEGIEVAPRGSDIRGRVARVQSAGRVRGAAELGLELTQIVVNGISYVLNTSEYREVAEGRGGETARRVGTGAGVGALIGLIAGGGEGAAIGAGVGAGAAGAVQVLTKGEKLYVPAETLIGFTLGEPLVVAAR
jgi:hypothetical protein